MKWTSKADRSLPQHSNPGKHPLNPHVDLEWKNVTPKLMDSAHIYTYTVTYIYIYIHTYSDNQGCSTTAPMSGTHSVDFKEGTSFSDTCLTWQNLMGRACLHLWSLGDLSAGTGPLKGIGLHMAFSCFFHKWGYPKTGGLQSKIL